MLNPKIPIKHYKIYLSCSNVSSVQVEPKHKRSKGILGSVMKYTRTFDEISTLARLRFETDHRQHHSFSTHYKMSS